MDLTREFLSEGQVSLMRFSLGLRVYSPKIEMFHQIAMVAGVAGMNCAVVAQANGKLTCKPEELDSLLAEELK